MTTSAAPPANCQYCGKIHTTLCPRIKRIEYSDLNPSMFKVVEFFAPNDYAPKTETQSVFDVVFGKR